MARKSTKPTLFSAALRLRPCATARRANCAYGQQRLLEIALALATKPKVLLLDEPAAGVPREESRDLFAAIAGLSRDITVLFIEHDMDLVFRFAIARHRHGRRPRAARRHADGDRRRSARARGLSRQSASGCHAVSEPLLSLHEVRAGYGPAVVLDGISLDVPSAAASPCSAATASASRRCSSPSWATPRSAAAASCGAAGTSRALAPHRRALAGIGWVAQEREIFSVADGRGKPHCRRAHRTLGLCRRSTSSSRAWRSGGATSATSYPAASSRCWRSRVR